MSRPAVALVALLLAGCASSATPDGVLAEAPAGEGRQSTPAKTDSYGRDSAGEFTVHSDASVSSCVGDQGEVAYRLNWQHVPLRQQANDTSVQVDLEWVATNPTNDWLRFRLVTDEQMGGPARLEWNGASPQSLLLVGKDLEALPETFYVQVSATGCRAEMPVGVHLSPGDQPVAWKVVWNTQSQG